MSAQKFFVITAGLGVISILGLFVGVKEVAIACVLLPLSFLLAKDLWTSVALVASLLFVLSIEFLNTAIERLCNHIQPDRHEAIRITKDLASAGVFFSLALAGIVWIAALWARIVQ